MGWLAMIGSGISALSQGNQGDETAAATRADAALKAAQIRKLAVRTQSEARAAEAASGVDVNSPTAKLIDENIASASTADEMNTILSGERAASAAYRASRVQALGTMLGATGGNSGGGGMSALGSIGQSFGRWKTAAPGGVGAG